MIIEITYLGQEWCNPGDIKLNRNQHITLDTTLGVLILCEKEKHIDIHTGEGFIKFVPVKYERLNRTGEDFVVKSKNKT